MLLKKISDLYICIFLIQTIQHTIHIYIYIYIYVQIYFQTYIYGEQKFEHGIHLEEQLPTVHTLLKSPVNN